MKMKTKTKTKTTHPFWHYLLMVFVSEVVNFVWLMVGVISAVSGYVIFSFSSEDFYKLALGIPIGLLGVSLTLLKIYELILVLVSPSRLKSICVFCKNI